MEKEYKIRKLTPMECFRLMDFDDESFLKAKFLGNEKLIDWVNHWADMEGNYYYDNAIEWNLNIHRDEKIPTTSNTQLYKMAGNSIVVNCLVGVIGQLFEGHEDDYKEINNGK